MLSHSENIKDLSYLSIIAALDKVQKRARSRLLDSHDVEKALGFLAYFERFASAVAVDVVSGYHIPGLIFPPDVTSLTIRRSKTDSSGYVRRGHAEKIPYLWGPRYKVRLVDVDRKALKVPAGFCSPETCRDDDTGRTVLMNSTIPAA
jgi:hypothetical protein